MNEATPSAQAAPPSGFDLPTALHLLGSPLAQSQRQSTGLLVLTRRRKLVRGRRNCTLEVMAKQQKGDLRPPARVLEKKPG